MRSYTRADIEGLNPNQNGVYGIFIGKGKPAIYIGSGDIRERLLVHIGGDNPCITKRNPNLWTAEVIQGDPTDRERVLITEYQPLCNIVIPR
jgi:hypothetical protein